MGSHESTSHQLVISKIRQQHEELVSSGKRIHIRNVCPLFSNFGKQCSRSPFEVSAAEAAAQLAEKHGVPRQFSTSINSTCSYVYPFAISRSRLYHLTLFMNMFFYLDDHGRDCLLETGVINDESKKTITAVEEMLYFYERHCNDENDCSALAPSSNFFYNITKPFFDDLRSASPRDYYNRVVHEILNSFKLSLQESKVFSIKEYQNVRAIDSGTRLIVDLLEYSINCYVTSADTSVTHRSQPLLQRTRELVVYIGFTFNDVVSYYKEIIQGECFCNTIAILLIENPEMQLLEALITTLEDIEKKFQEFRNLMTEMHFHHADVPQKYLSALEKFVSGFVTWVVSGTSRYNIKNSILRWD